MTPRMVPITCHCTLKKLGKKGQFVCNLVKKKLRGGGACFFFQEAGAIGMGRGWYLCWNGFVPGIRQLCDLNDLVPQTATST